MALAAACRKPYEQLRDIRYAGHAGTVLDLYWPRSGSRTTGILTIHGGGWREGSREDCWRRVCRRYLERGCVVANAGYRLAPRHRAPAAVEDIRSAVDWFRRRGAEWGVDPKRIVVAGESAGGHLAMMAGVTAGGAAAVISFAGISALWDLFESRQLLDALEAWIPPGPGRRSMADAMSPLRHVSKDAAPMFLVHGDRDPLVPYSQSVQMAEALARVNVAHRLRTIPGGGHSAFAEQTLDEVYQDIFQWLRRLQLLD